MPLLPACSLWLKAIGWTGEGSRRSSGRMYIAIMPATAARDATASPEITHTFFTQFTAWDQGKDAQEETDFRHYMLAGYNCLSNKQRQKGTTLGNLDNVLAI
jgi:hypothetical protein